MAANGNNGNNSNGGGNGNGNGSEISTAQTVYLKGSGSNFNKGGWENLFFAGFEDEEAYDAYLEKGNTPNVWHLVYSGKVIQSVTSMQVTFTNGVVFKWDPNMGFSVNGGSNNFGWVIVAPYDWTIAYIDKGNNNNSDSFVVTTETSNVQFNISGFQAGGPPKYHGELTLHKTVDGVLIAEWDLDGVGINDVIDDIYFELYKAATDAGGNPTGIDGQAIGVTGLDNDSNITFKCKEELSGWYAVEEEFTPGSLAEEIFEEADPLYIYINNGAVVGGINVDFDYGALYTIVNGYSGSYIRTLEYQGLNNTGDVFYIGVTNTETGEKYPSYCAHAGSKNFAGDANHGCKGYMCALSGREIEAVDFDRFLSALNYIEDNYGNLNENRVITQVITWVLLDAIDITSEEFEAANLIDAEKAAVKDVMANSEGYKGKGAIVDVVYMTCELHGTTGFGFENCQPQLIPIYGEYVDIFFNNKSISGGGLGIDDASTANVSFNKTKYGGLLPVGADEFAFELYKMNTEEGSYDSLVGTYKTAQGGLVTATGLAPGEYVFREKWAVDHTTGYDDDEHAHYSNVWKATYPCDDDTCVFSGGLFFTINAKGDAIWPECYDLDETGAPMVNNEHYCKHAVLWSDTPFDLYGDPESGNKTVISCFEYEGGWITIIGGDCGNNSVYVHEIQVASCTLPGKIEFRCNTCTFRFAIDTSPVLDHDYECLKPEWQWLGLDENGEDLYGLFDIWKCTLCGKYDRQRIE
jgi:hypothetical protein